MSKYSIIIIVILIFGAFYKVILTSNGNFIFNMDNARDMVDIREMVVLRQPRLIGPTSGIEGLFNGPYWYYLLAIPFILTGGSPYMEVILMIILWVVGGYFLLKILSRYGSLVVLAGGLIWTASNYVTLATIYAYNPNPVVLLTPLFIFLLEKYLKTNSSLYSIGVWFLGGLFFNFEMAFGVFVPVIIILSLLLSGKKWFIKDRAFFLGFTFFLAALLPQLLFELRHNFFMFKSVANYLKSSSSGHYSLVGRLEAVRGTYLGALSGTLMNWGLLTKSFLVVFVFILVKFIKDKTFVGDQLQLIIYLFLTVPPTIHLLLPINVMPWHLGGTMAAAIVFVGVVLGVLAQAGRIGKFVFYALVAAVTVYAINNLELGKNLFNKEISNDPAVFINEINAVDYVYQQADGKNFKVYIYLPSVIDYPYQYLFWWYGQNKYGYLPKDYAYLPDKPQYIKNKEKFNAGNDPEDSGLIFLIKQPDTHQQRHLWENDFSRLPLLNSAEVGPLTIETRRQVP